MSASQQQSPLSYYFCYQCDRYVSIYPPPSPASDLECPNCHGGFLEEAPDYNPNPNPGFPANFPFIFSTEPHRGVAMLRTGDFDELSAVFGARSPAEFNPFDFLNTYLSGLQSRDANIQVIFESPGNFSGGNFRAPANLLGDYFFGPGLEHLIQQLAENDPNRYGTPPASKAAVKDLPDVMIDEGIMASDSSQCAVCMDSFELSGVAKMMPCKHTYHKDCILPWLELHNSCPVCRYELPTDDPDYENRKNGTNQNSNNNTGGNINADHSGGGNNDNEATADNSNNNSGEQTLRTVERRFRIPLPWIFRGFGLGAETSGVGNREGGNNSGDGNSGARDSTDEARTENLD